MKYDRAGLVAAARSGTLEAFLKEAYRDAEGEDWEVLVSGAVDAHHKGEFDLIACFGEQTGKPNYASQDFLKEALSQLDLPLESILRFIDVIAVRSNGEDTPYYLANAFSKWCENDPDRPLNALSAIRAGSAPIHLLRGALLSGLKVDRDRLLPLLIDMLEGDKPQEREAAGQLLGAFEAFTRPERDRAAAALGRALANARDTEVSTPLRALLSISLREEDGGTIGLRALAHVAASTNAEMRAAIATEMMFKRGKIARDFAEAAFSILEATAPDELATLDPLDQIISTHLKGDLADLAANLLDRLLARGIPLRTFDSVRHDFMQDGALRTGTVIRWLLSGKLRHAAAIQDLCLGWGERAIEFHSQSTRRVTPADRRMASAIS